uniref:Peptidyl-prolyl cis-trans isomerase (PPIase) (EC) n=1 Tax=Ganoderma boninense TaxID=34458 RepID=A0A5K1K3K6_9APHY|nr:Peptidyl-prolyl cis-trans isomerase (PPIase) (EC [Ganoderma boninense]
MAPTTQKALIIPVEKGPQKLVTDWPVPKPGPADVLVKLVSAAVNPVDAYIPIAGGLGLVNTWPLVNGIDGAGIVEEVGAEVTNVAKGDKVFFMGGFNNRRATFQEYAVYVASRVAKIPENITFDQASTISLCLATVVTAIWADEEGAKSVQLTPPWEANGKTKYAGKAALILAGSTSVGQYAIQCARMQGFSPIITTASPKHTAFLQSLGATHIIDRSRSSAEITAALPALTGGKPIEYVYDSFGRDRDAQRLGFGVLAPGGAFVTVNPRDPEYIADLVEESEKKGEGKRVARAFGSYDIPGNGKLGDEIFSRLPGWLETGVLVPSRVEVLPNGLAGIDAGCEKLLKGQVSGAKLVVHISETP